MIKLLIYLRLEIINKSLLLDLNEKIEKVNENFDCEKLILF